MQGINSSPTSTDFVRNSGLRQRLRETIVPAESHTPPQASRSSMQLARLSHVSLGVQSHFHYHLPGILSRWRFLSYKRVNETTTQGGTGFHALKIAGELLAERTATWGRGDVCDA
jgi:hypothetical protein